MKIQQIRNATLKIQYASRTILIDPWLQDKGTGPSAQTLKPEMAGIKNPVDELPMRPEEIIRDVDFCLVTHIHPDHFSEDYLPKSIHIIVQNQDDRDKLCRMGFENVVCFCGPEIKIGNITLIKTPAVHGDKPEVAEIMGEVSGYIIKGEEKTLYIAGDTVYYEGVGKTIEKYSPDVILLNCCEATLPMGRLIMNLADIEAVCKKAPEATVIATHLDSVNHALLSSKDVKAFVLQKGLRQVRVPYSGERIDI